MYKESTDDSRRILKRFEGLWSERKTVEQQWQTIEKFVAPYRGKFFQDNTGEGGIEWRKRDIYDATAVQAHIQLAASIHGALTNPAIRWFMLQWRDPEMRKNWEAQTWIENAGKVMFDCLQDSNFNLEANNVYRNLTSFATAAIVEEPKADFTEPWEGVQFTSIPLKQAYFEPDDNGQCLNFYRLMRWRASKIVAKFGYDNVPDVVQSRYDSVSDEEIPIIFAICTHQDKMDNTATLIKPEDRPYQWKYVMRNGGAILDEGGYYEMPAYVARWEVTDESMWGNGPAHYALADILTLNQMVELDLTSREKVIDPAIMAAERALLTDLKLGPGDVNVVRDPDQVKPFESAARFDAVESTISRLQFAVQKYFYIDQLELKESPAMTATEVQVRAELMQRLLSSTMSRLKEDFLDPLLQRTFNLLFRAGQFGDPPANIELSEYDIEYVGPLSRSMKFDQSASIERWITQLQLIAQTGELAQEVLLVPDYDKIARQAARDLNLPTELTRPKEQVDADKKRMADQQVRQASADAAVSEAAAVKDLGQAEQLRGGQQGLTAVGP